MIRHRLHSIARSFQPTLEALEDRVVLSSDLGPTLDLAERVENRYGDVGEARIIESGDAPESLTEFQEQFGDDLDQTNGAGQEPTNESPEPPENLAQNNAPSEADDAVNDFDAVAGGELPQSQNTDATDAYFEFFQGNEGTSAPDYDSNAPQDPYGGAASISEGSNESSTPAQQGESTPQESSTPPSQEEEGSGSASTTKPEQSNPEGETDESAGLGSGGDDSSAPAATYNGPRPTNPVKVSPELSRRTHEVGQRVGRLNQQRQKLESALEQAQAAGDAARVEATSQALGRVQRQLNYSMGELGALTKAHDSLINSKPGDPGPDGGTDQGPMTNLHQQVIRNAVPQNDPRGNNVDPVETTTGNETGGGTDQSHLDLSNPGSAAGTGSGVSGSPTTNTPPPAPIDYGPDHVQGQATGPYEDAPDLTVGESDLDLPSETTESSGRTFVITNPDVNTRYQG